MTKVHLMVCTPMYGGQCYGHYMQSVLELQKMVTQLNWQMEFRFTSNEALITRARNGLAEQFLASGATHLLFIDGDMLFNPTEIINLVRFDVDVVGGVCAKKVINWELVKEFLQANPTVDPYQIQTATAETCINFSGDGNDSRPGLMEVKHIGTGCMLIKRDVFVKLKTHVKHHIDAGRDGKSTPVAKPLYFDCSTDAGGYYLSEDYHFCELWRSIGGKIWAAYGTRLKHVGTHVFG